MNTFLSQLNSMLATFTRRHGRKSRRSLRNRQADEHAAEIQLLEPRKMMTVTFQGGPVLTHVDIQPVFYGSDWATTSYSSQVNYLKGYTDSMASGTYLPMLGNAGYTDAHGTPIGTGTSESAAIIPGTLSKTSALTDGVIQFALQASIQEGVLKAPNSNSLYIVYVEDNVLVQSGNKSSNNGFLGYHQHFSGVDAQNHKVDIHYAVVDYPGGTHGNYTLPWLSTLGTLTTVASHELGEAVTDPDLNGWWETSSSAEIGDLANGQSVFLNGYAVQRMSDPFDQPMIPVGGTVQTPASFVLSTSGVLQVHSNGNWTTISSNVASVSDQGIDFGGQAMVDFITTGSVAYEYHLSNNSTLKLGTGVKSAVAGDGVSYVVSSTNVLNEYHDVNYGGGGNWTYLDNLAAGSQISAGTDLHGINTVYVRSSGGGVMAASDSQWNANSNWFVVASGVSSISGGQFGEAAYVGLDGNGYTFLEGHGNTPSKNTLVANNVKQITSGTDQNGNTMIDVLSKNGTLTERRGTSWTTLGSNVGSISKGREGLIDLIFTNGNCDEHTSSGLVALNKNAAEAG